MKVQSKDKKGFTLIELLLALGVFSIMIVVLLTLINPAKRIGMARDAVRKNDLKALERAIEAYWVENGATLPGSGGTTYLSTVSSSAPQNADGTGWIPVNMITQMKTLPIDPINDGNYFYGYVRDGSVPNSNKFLLYTPMEADLDAAKDDGRDNDVFETGTGFKDVPLPT
jgi:prepilin-type N-terminal cleavage/methylation domain-containing protein